MGLALVELVMAVEERFRIEIPDSEAQRLTTPRQLIDFVCQRVQARGEQGCSTQRSFYRVRREVMTATGAARKAVRPEVALDALFPWRERRRLWPPMARRFGLAPKLRRPRWLTAALALMTALTLGAVVLSGTRHEVLLALTVPPSFALLALGATQAAAVCINLTVGELARLASWTRTAVADTVRQLIRDQLGLKSFSDDARFIEDLRIDT